MSDIYKTAPVPTIDEVYAIARHHGELAERKRIIKLLEDLDPYGPIDTAFVPELIELIKGEQK